jgi:hypothetical protein
MTKYALSGDYEVRREINDIADTYLTKGLTFGRSDVEMLSRAYGMVHMDGQQIGQDDPNYKTMHHKVTTRIIDRWLAKGWVHQRDGIYTVDGK